MKTLKIHGKTFVLRTLVRVGGTNVGKQVQPNFMGTGMACCGILQDDESLESFCKRKHIK